jgi:SAM-dependent methyltransferase
VKRCVYYMPLQAQEDYWEELWSERDLRRQIDAGPKKAWWPDLCRLLDGLAPEALVLEAGCGMGQFVYLLHERGRRTIGVDRAAEAIRRTRAAFPQLDLRVADVARLDLPDASVGLYISLGVVEHVPEGPQAILREAARVVEDGGLLFITVPYYNVYRRLREPWWRIKHGRAKRAGRIAFYQYAFSRREFESILRDAGFTPIAHKLHHPRVALRKDLPWVERRLSRSRVKRLLALLERHPLLLSHMLLVVARREPRQAG